MVVCYPEFRLFFRLDCITRNMDIGAIMIKDTQ
jgi:hypothetical protein